MLSKAFCRILTSGFATLTRVDAEARAIYIKKNSIDYANHLTLHKGTIYDGLANISFEINTAHTYDK